jgi:hypothetical protein
MKRGAGGAPCVAHAAGPEMEHRMSGIPVAALLSAMLFAPFAAAQDAQTDEQSERADRFARLRRNAVRLIEAFDQLGPWEEHYDYMIDAVEKVYERNGWTSEPDRFSLEVVREVESLPPTAFQERFQAMMQIVSDRYLLDEQQERRLGRTMARESTAFFLKHSDRILEYAVDAIETRAAGEAITAEKVARWVELAGPVFDDAQHVFNRTAAQFSKSLDPEQRRLVQRDLDAANRRMKRIGELRVQWQRGDWQPSDWGIETDPIQLAGEQRAAGKARADKPEKTGGKTASARGEPAKPAEDAAHDFASADNDLWAQYVRSFIRKYHLNDGQQQRAWAIHADVKERRDALRRRFAKLNTAQDRATSRAATLELTPRQRATLDRLFEQMKRRLERLPTRAQRKNADTGKLDSRKPEKADQRQDNGP